MARRQRPDLPKPDTAETSDLRPAQLRLKTTDAPKRNRGGRPRSADPKVPISIRLDRAVVEKFRATGPGWQGRINEVLRNAELEGAPVARSPQSR
jgi:uncharacterized protein (DUF4415 family)